MTNRTEISPVFVEQARSACTSPSEQGGTTDSAVQDDLSQIRARGRLAGTDGLNRVLAVAM